MKEKIGKLIQRYAEVYQDFEELQKQKVDNPELTGGDQKTGVIAEYYAKCYIEATFGVEATYAKAGKPFDISYNAKSGKLVEVQVKGVSEHSETRAIAPLRLIDSEGNPAFDYLYLVDLDRNFLPAGLYINTWEQVTSKTEEGRIKIQGSKMRDTEKGRGGSAVYDFTDNKVEELKKALPRADHRWQEKKASCISQQPLSETTG